jgi:uncharacterized protein (TIGR03086 family)
MDKILDWHSRAVQEFGRRVHLVRPDQWGRATPCGDWQVRDLVNHLVVEQLWVPPLLAGQTIAEVGNRFDGDQLGEDPVGAWDESSAAAHAALTEPGALDRVVHLSYGDRRAHEYAMDLTFDLVVHTWDLARGLGVDERVDPELVDQAYEYAESQADVFAGSGLFASPVPVGDDAGKQSRLVALTGRNPAWPV